MRALTEAEPETLSPQLPKHMGAHSYKDVAALYLALHLGLHIPSRYGAGAAEGDPQDAGVGKRERRSHLALDSRVFR